MNLLEIGVAVAIAIGLTGMLIPVLPGGLLILVAIVVWAWETGGSTAWTVAAIAALFLVAGQVIKYVVPGRRMRDAGVPRRSLLIGALLGVIGFFVIPVLGLFVGFLLGIYLAEHMRVGQAAAWPSTISAVKAVLTSIAIELTSAVLATAVWIVGVSIT
ncbi:MAG: DUF456 domain-containing protein [Nocardioides sp.]